MLGALAAALLALAAPASASAATQVIQANRGGPTIGGVHRFGEETMSAFQHAWSSYGAVLEMDVKLTADRVPIVFHDTTLDRVTPCIGRTDAHTLGQLAGCPVDIVGSPEYELGGGPAAQPEPIPRLAEVLAWARGAGPVLNLEIKNHPTEEDFDPGEGYANAVMDVVVASAFPAERLIIQSHWPRNLEVAESRLPGIQTALITVNQLNPGAPAFAAANGISMIIPQWPVDKDYVERAHSLGVAVVPYTLDHPDVVRTAAQIGVDAVLSDDPLMARRALGIPDPPEVDRNPPSLLLRIPELASTGAMSPRLVLRWEARDPSGVVGFDVDVRSGRTGWRELVHNGAAQAAAFTATPGERYVARVRARDGAGNRSDYAFAGFSVPFDLRPRGWRVLKRSRAWMGTLAEPRRRTAALTFVGTRLRILAERLPKGGTLTVTLDGRRRRVSTRGPKDDRVVVYDSGQLRSRLHRVRLRASGRVLLDGYARY